MFGSYEWRTRQTRELVRQSLALAEQSRRTLAREASLSADVRECVSRTRYNVNRALLRITLADASLAR